jgi:hypothetical protein
MIVQNISGRDIKIPELRKIIKAGSGYISLDYNIAKKYKKFLKPIQMSDTLMNSKLSNNDIAGKGVEETTVAANIVPEVVGIVEKEVVAPVVEEEVTEVVEEEVDEAAKEKAAKEAKALAKKESDKAKRAAAARERRAKAKKAKKEKASKNNKNEFTKE